MIQLHSNGDLVCSVCGQVITRGKWYEQAWEKSWDKARELHFDSDNKCKVEDDECDEG